MKIRYTPVNADLLYVEVGFMEVYMTHTCFRDVQLEDTAICMSNSYPKDDHKFHSFRNRLA